MRRIAILAVFVMLIGLVAAANPAAAAPPDAADFAADCNDDGRVDVTGRQRYVGGTGTLTGTCSVVMEPGARLVLRRVTLDGTGGLLANSSPADTRIRVIDSSIDLEGSLELTAGCCSGEGDGSERDGRVIVRRSSLAAESIQLLGSFDDPRGRLVVRASTLTATGSLGVQIRASDLGGTAGVVRVIDTAVLSAGDVDIATGAEGSTVVRRTSIDTEADLSIRTGHDGVVRVVGSLLTSDGGLEIASGDRGRTLVRRNEAAFDGEAQVVTGTDGRCVSRRNLPVLPCGSVVDVPADGVEPEDGGGEPEAGGNEPEAGGGGAGSNEGEVGGGGAGSNEGEAGGGGAGA